MSPEFYVAILIAVIGGGLIVFGAFNSRARQYISDLCAPARKSTDDGDSEKESNPTREARPPGSR